MQPMQPYVDEIADGIHRIATFLPDVSPEGFTMNQFLVVADEPLLFHTGPRALFPLVAEAVQTIMPIEKLRWISFGHVESDECGAMNMWLASAPHSEVVFGALGCDISLRDLCDRPPRALADGEVLDLGGKRVRQLATPHVPHGWEAQVLFEETTRTLFVGDLLTQIGPGPAITEADILPRALATEAIFHATALAPHTPDTLRRLAALAPTTLAIMHGSSYRGDGRRMLHATADAYAAMLAGAEVLRASA